MSTSHYGPKGAGARRPQVLAVDDAEGIRTYLKNLLGLRGYDVVLAEDGARALELLTEGAAPEVILLDVMMPGMDGIETLRRIKEQQPDIPVIMLSVVGKASTIVEAMGLGAADYLNKPFEEEELEIAIRKVLETQNLRGENRQLRAQLRAHEEETRGSYLWISDKMIRIRELVEQVADADVTVLVHGESGSGKEVIARTVHQFSNRAQGPFVKVNCAALPEELLESELFGYERGAFTGASGRKAGKFELANEGTIFMDEIGEMSPPLQAKLLQVLQDGEFCPLGGQRDVRVDVRVVAATNRNLEEMVSKGGFREDLFYRLNVVNVWVPPLRERPEEIPVLVEHFLVRFSQKYKREYRPLSDQLLQGMIRYAWPGNVRELENVMKRIVVLQSEESILEDVLSNQPRLRERPSEVSEPDVAPSAASEPVADDSESVSLRDIGRRAAREAEREALKRVLYQTNWNRKKAARILEVSYKTLLQKIKECGLAE